MNDPMIGAGLTSLYSSQHIMWLGGLSPSITRIILIDDRFFSYFTLSIIYTLLSMKPIILSFLAIYSFFPINKTHRNNA